NREELGEVGPAGNFKHADGQVAVHLDRPIEPPCEPRFPHAMDAYSGFGGAENPIPALRVSVDAGASGTSSLNTEETLSSDADAPEEVVLAIDADASALAEFTLARELAPAGEADLKSHPVGTGSRSGGASGLEEAACCASGTRNAGSNRRVLRM